MDGLSKALLLTRADFDDLAAKQEGEVTPPKLCPCVAVWVLVESDCDPSYVEIEYVYLTDF